MSGFTKVDGTFRMFVELVKMRFKSSPDHDFVAQLPFNVLSDQGRIQGVTSIASWDTVRFLSISITTCISIWVWPNFR